MPPGYPPQFGAQHGYPGHYAPGNPMPWPMGYQGGQHPQHHPGRQVRFQLQLNLRYIFLALIGFLIYFVQGGPNSMWYTIILLGVAWQYWRRLGPRNRNPQNPQNPNNPQPNNPAQNQPQNAQQAPRNPQGEQPEQNFPDQGGFDRLERNNAQGDSVPAILRYDWRVHHGIAGEILGVICPFFFSLWPTWNPSILGDHPDLIRRRQAEQAEEERRRNENPQEAQDPVQ